MIVAIQFGLAFILFLFSTLASWYEGSEILNWPSEWKYTAFFSQLNGEIVHASDISPLDHFIYAIKFRPTFPLLMFLSGSYLLILIGYLFLKQHHKYFAYFLFLFSVILIVSSTFISNSPTSGAKIIYRTMIFSSVFIIIVALVYYFQMFNRQSKRD